MPTCIAQKSFDAVTKIIEEATKPVATASMKVVLQEELREITEQDEI